LRLYLTEHLPRCAPFQRDESGGATFRATFCSFGLLD
jgi:hypothetical protein